MHYTELLTGWAL